MLIKGERIGLCAMEGADAPDVHGWVHEPDLRRLAFMDFQFPQTQEATGAWIREMNQDPRSRLLAIRRHDDNALIGMLTVRRISWISRSLRFGIMLWPPAVQGHGLGTEARRIFLDYVFRQMGFRRVYGDFGSFNVASRKSHEKLGAVVSARAREAGWADGAFYDVCHYTYQRELFLESSETMPRAAADETAECVTGDLERCYMDFQLVPDLADGGAGRAEWLRRLDGVTEGDALTAMQVDWTRCSASLLLFRRTGSAPWQAGAVPRELLARVLDRSDHELNLHRIQTVAPVTAHGLRTLLGSAGFHEEGTLDALHYAHGRYVDLAILGRVRPE